MRKFLFKTLALTAGAAAAVYAGYVAFAFKRYGRPDVSGSPDPLLDEFMPEYEVRDYHRVHVNAPAAMTMKLATRLRLDEGGLTKFLFALRTLPSTLRGHTVPPVPSGGIEVDAAALGWGLLANVPERHLVMGAVTEPWKIAPVFQRVERDSFAAFDIPGYAKIAWAVRVQQDGPDASFFSVETRVATTDAESRRKFRRYWAFLSPGIKAIRHDMLDIVKKEAERRVHQAA